MTTCLNTLYMYLVWEEIGDVLHCVRGDKGTTPWIIKLAGVSRVKVPKSYIYLGAGSLGRSSVKWQEMEVYE